MKEEPLARSQQVVELNAEILRQRDVSISQDAMILDYGCGSGRHTYEYLDAGFHNTLGFDVQDYVELRDPTDRRRFHFLEEGSSFRIPFPDDHFDLVTSTSVFEHVTNLDESVSEIARVLKPDGVTLHVFPSRWRPIEPHLFVPFGGAIQSHWWLWIWANLGVRNEYQRGLSAREVVSRNREYCSTGVHYPPFKSIDATWRRRFASVEYAEPAFIAATREISRVSRFAERCSRIVPGLVALYRIAHFRVILARQPRGASW